MTSPTETQDRLIYVQWSDDGQHIRKWAREPFDGATAFANAGNGAPLGPFDADDHYPIKDLPFALREVAQNIHVQCADHVLEDMVRIVTDAASALEDRTAHSGEEKCTVCGIANKSHYDHAAPFTENYHPFSGEGRSNGAGEDVPLERWADISDDSDAIVKCGERWKAVAAKIGCSLHGFNDGTAASFVTPDGNVIEIGPKFRALIATLTAPPTSEERLRKALADVDCITRLRDELGGKIELTWLDPKQSWPLFNLLSEINSGNGAALSNEGEER